MQISSLLGRAFGAAASVALLASCSGVTSQGTPSVGGATSAQSSSHANTFNRSALMGKTSVSARGYVNSGKIGRSSGGGPLVDKKTQVVYVSDAGNEEVYGYDQTGGSPFITIGGFSEPQGIGTDNVGNLYVANTEGFDIEVFAPGSTTASMTIPTAGYPAGVAVGGNYIYVSNIIGQSSQPGSLQSFYKKTGAPYRSYSCGLEEAFFVATDSHGNVFVDGFDSSFASTVWEFPQGSLSCTVLPISINFPGGLQVDKSGNLVVDDQEGNTTSYAPPGFSTVVATSDNGGSESYDPVTIALTKGNANIWTANAGAETLTEWPYPASGTPSLTITGFSEPIGVATYERGNK